MPNEPITPPGTKLRMTAKRRETFLAELARHGNITAAAAASPNKDSGAVVRATFYDLRKRDPEFKAAWDYAVDMATASVDLELHRRAVEGYDEPVYSQKLGTQIGTIRKYSDRLLLALAKKLDPSYRDGARIDIHNENNLIKGVLIVPGPAVSSEEWELRHGEAARMRSRRSIQTRRGTFRGGNGSEQCRFLNGSLKHEKGDQAMLDRPP